MATTPEEQNLKLFDKADFEGWNGPDWNILREMHTDDVHVEWNGEVTDGYAAHEAVLRSVTEQYPDLKVTAHPIKVADGEWTATVGELTGGGKMMTLARWRDGAISEEYLWIPGV